MDWATLVCSQVRKVTDSANIQENELKCVSFDNYYFLKPEGARIYPRLLNVHLFPELQSYYHLNHCRWHLDTLFSNQGFQRFDAITQRFCLLI